MFAGIGSYTFPWAVAATGDCHHRKLSAEALLQRAYSEGIHYVQIGDNMPLHLLPRAAVLALKQTAGLLAINIQVGTRGLRNENIITYLELAALLQSPFLRMVIDEGSFEPAVAEIIEIITGVLPLLRQREIKLAIENHDRLSAKALEEIILATDPHWVGVCLDTANSMGSGESIRETVAVLAPYTLNLHLKDVCIKRVEHKMGFVTEGTVAGEGMLDLPWIVGQLQQWNKCDSAILECWSNPCDSMEATLNNEEQVAQKSIGYLKKILLL